MTNQPKLEDLLPEQFLRIIRDRIKAGVVDAEAKFRLSQDEEDAVTGALAQSISTASPIIFKGDKTEFGFQIESYKLRGRGDGAPEKRLGADGILQIAVTKNGRQVFAKGLPFQAKKFGGFTNAAVVKQAKHLYETSSSGLIVRYSDKGYTGVDVRQMLRGIAVGGPTKKPTTESLATILGDHFLNCEIGRLNLRYDREVVEKVGKGAWVIDAVVKGEGQF